MSDDVAHDVHRLVDALAGPLYTYRMAYPRRDAKGPRGTSARSRLRTAEVELTEVAQLWVAGTLRDSCGALALPGERPCYLAVTPAGHHRCRKYAPHSTDHACVCGRRWVEVR